MDDTKLKSELVRLRNLDELVDLLNDVYGQGYMCGINDSTWFYAYALAIYDIINGAKFSDELVDGHYLNITNPADIEGEKC